MTTLMPPAATAADRNYTIQDLAGELQRQLATKRDLMVITENLSVTHNADTLVVNHPVEGEMQFSITDHSHGQMCEYHKVGSHLYKHLRLDHPGLLEDLMNGMFQQDETKTRLIRTMDGKVRAFLSNGYRPRDNWDLLDQAILPELGRYGGKIDFKACELTETRMYVKVVFPDIAIPITPKVGDVMRAGLIVKNSEVGSGSLGIYPYSDILWCTNGMVHTEYGKTGRHVGGRITSDEAAWDIYSDATIKLDDQAYFSKCRDVVKSIIDATVFEQIAASMQDLAALDLGVGPLDAVKDVTKRHDFSEAESNSILTALVSGGDLSRWGLVNAITQTARDHKSADRRVDLETLAGKMVEDPSLLVAA